MMQKFHDIYYEILFLLWGKGSGRGGRRLQQHTPKEKNRLWIQSPECRTTQRFMVILQGPPMQLESPLFQSYWECTAAVQGPWPAKAAQILTRAFLIPQPIFNSLILGRDNWQTKFAQCTTITHSKFFFSAI